MEIMFKNLICTGLLYIPDSLSISWLLYLREKNPLLGFQKLDILT